jgi:plasmid stabilization system protein ParE
VVEYIARDSQDGAVRVLVRALDVAASVAALAERGRVVPELNDSTVRELFVFDYRLLYQVAEDRVVVIAFLHGARDFSKWLRDQALKP